MTTTSASAFDSASHALTAELLPRLRHGDRGAFPALYERVQQRVERLAEAVVRRRGSPDGFRDQDDLLNGVWNEIHRQPERELSGVLNSDDLLSRLSVRLFDRWIKHRRRALAWKRGGGRIQAASQYEGSDSADLLEQKPARGSAEFDSEVALVLDDLFPTASEPRVIVERLLAGHTQAEIGAMLGLSRHALGRRIRNEIAPLVARLLADERRPDV